MDETLKAPVEDYKYGFSSPEDYIFKAEKGLNETIVRQISAMKNEPEWMLEMRLRAYRHFLSRPMPNWGSPKMYDINFDEIYYYIKPTEKCRSVWRASFTLPAM
jgi:Fe-S cluster assembly protein SufB